MWILLSFCLFMLWIAIDTVRFGIAPTPSTAKARKAMIQAIAPPKRGKIYELGSGWGRLAFDLAKAFPNCEIVAYEASLIPWCFSRFLQSFYGYDNLTIERDNFFSITLRDADYVFCYLYPGAMTQLQKKFEQELPSNAQIISNTFSLLGWKAESVQPIEDLYNTNIYLYKMSSAF